MDDDGGGSHRGTLFYRASTRMVLGHNFDGGHQSKRRDDFIPESPGKIREIEHRRNALSYNKIEELIYAGDNMCCQTHFDQELLAKGIAADISLEGERLESPRGVRYFFWFPWVEDTAPSTELILVAINSFAVLLEHDIKTYIHCKNGHGRTTTFLASYFISKKGITAEEALALVREKSPSAHLNEVQRTFLKDFEKIVKN